MYQFRLLRIAGTALTAGLGAALLGCGSDTAPLPDNGQPPAALVAQMPPIPVENTASRAGSAVQDTTIQGADFFMKSPGAIASTQNLLLPSSAGAIEYGIYLFATAGGTPLSVKAHFTPQTGDSVWLALANYDQLAWEFNGPYLSDTVVPFDASNVSPGGNLYFAVVTFNGTSILLNNSTVSADMPSGLDINMNLSSFDQPIVNVDPGTTITWHNVSAFSHTVTTDALNADPGGPNSDLAQPSGVPADGTYSFTVPGDTPSGTQWFYHCRFHGSAGDGSSVGSGMAAVINVN